MVGIGYQNMPITAQTLQNRVDTLQKLQKKRLDGKKFSDLPYELQIDYCRTNKELSKFSYQCYQIMKTDPALDSLTAKYFILSFLKFCNADAYAEANMATREPASILTIRNNIPNIDPAEDFNLAIRHLMGIGFPKNRDNAIVLLKIAAEKNNPNAQAILGELYQTGVAIPNDHKKANGYLKKAADQGNAYGQIRLARAYKNGYGVTQNIEETIKLYKCAADKGYLFAQISLMYILHGEEHIIHGVPYPENWLRYLAEQDVAEHQYELATQLEGQKQWQTAGRWFRRAAEQMHGNARDILRSSGHLSFNYHQKMLSEKKENIITLIRDNPKLSDELLFDMNRRAVTRGGLNALDMINLLISRGIHSKSLTTALNEYNINNVIKIHQQLQ